VSVLELDGREIAELAEVTDELRLGCLVGHIAKRTRGAGRLRLSRIGGRITTAIASTEQLITRPVDRTVSGTPTQPQRFAA
jgi:hypothetical protein